MNSFLSAQEFESRLKKVKLLLLDVDGILTDASIFYVAGQGWTRTYCVYDGYGIRLLQKLGLPVGIISGGSSDELKERIKLLGIQHFVIGSEDKLASLREIERTTGIAAENICFMGDELFDMPAMQNVGLSVTVPDAMDEVKEIANWMTKKKGGQGAVREIIDAIRKAQDLKL